MKARGFIAGAVGAVAVLVAAGIFAVTGTQSSTKTPEAAYAAVVQWTTDLQKANFYDACALEVYDNKLNVTQEQLDKDGYGKDYTARRYCAISHSGISVDILRTQPRPVTLARVARDDYSIFQAKFSYLLGLIDKKTQDAIIKAAQPHTEKLRPPKNGYVFRVVVGQGQHDAFISVQRDANGDWKVTDIYQP